MSNMTLNFKPYLKYCNLNHLLSLNGYSMDVFICYLHLSKKNTCSYCKILQILRRIFESNVNHSPLSSVCIGVDYYIYTLTYHLPSWECSLHSWWLLTCKGNFPGKRYSREEISLGLFPLFMFLYITQVTCHDIKLARCIQFERYTTT